MNDNNHVKTLLEAKDYIFNRNADEFWCNDLDNLSIYVWDYIDGKIYFVFEYRGDAGYHTIIYYINKNKVVFNHLRDEKYKITIN